MAKQLRDARLTQRSLVLEQHHGLVFRGTVTTYTDTTHFKVSGFPEYGEASDFGNDFFKDYYIYVVWDKAGAGGAPQGENKQATAYTSTDGTLTHAAFTVPLEVGDEILLLHPSISSALSGSLDVPTADTTDNVLERDVIGNKTDTAVTTSGVTKSIMAYVKGAITELGEVLDLTRTGADIAVSAETNLFIDDAPTKVINGLSVKIDTTDMGAGDTYEFKVYYRVESAGSYIQQDPTITYTGVQSAPLKVLGLEPYRYGCKVTGTKTAGVDRSFPIEAIREA